MTENSTERCTLTLDRQEVSYLHDGEGAPVLLLHGTFWSRVWLPVISKLVESHEVFAPDYPGFGRSEGRLEPEEATAPALTEPDLRVTDALGIEAPFALAGHYIGGDVAQQVAVRGEGRVSRLALVNSVLYGSWPGSALEQFRDDLEYACSIAPDELVGTVPAPGQRRPGRRTCATRRSY